MLRQQAQPRGGGQAEERDGTTRAAADSRYPLIIERKKLFIRGCLNVKMNIDYLVK